MAKVAKKNLKQKPKSSVKTKTKAKATAKGKPKAKAAASAGSSSKGSLKKRSALKSAAKSNAKTAMKAIQKTSPVRKTATEDFSSIFTPLDDRVLVQRSGVSDRTPGGLYIPDTVQAGDRPKQGRVVAVGRGHRDKKGRLRPLDVRLGDLVMFAEFGGADVKLFGEDLLCIRENEIIAVVKS